MDPFPPAALFTGRCNHIPAKLPSCNTPPPPPPPPTNPNTHTHKLCDHKHGSQASFTTAGKDRESGWPLSVIEDTRARHKIKHGSRPCAVVERREKRGGGLGEDYFPTFTPVFAEITPRLNLQVNPKYFRNLSPVMNLDW